MPGSTVYDANKSYNEYFNTQPAAIGPSPPQTLNSSAERSEDHPEPFEVYFTSSTHSMDALDVRSRGPRRTFTDAPPPSQSPIYSPSDEATRDIPPFGVEKRRAQSSLALKPDQRPVKRKPYETEMEAEYDKGVSQNQSIVQDIKSAYIEIIFYQSSNLTSNLTEVVEQCVSDVYDNLLTYTVSVWEEDTTPKGDIFRLGLYVVWNSLPLTTQTQVTGTKHKPDDMHMQHVRTPGEISTYLLQILPRETRIDGFHEIICSPSNVMDTIMYGRGYVPGKPESNATFKTDTSRRIRRGVLASTDNAAMYVEYGKHPLGLTDVSINIKPVGTH